MRVRTLAATLAALLPLAAAAPAAAQLPIPLPGGSSGGAPIQPYGTNDAGGFRNILPPGEAGTDNALDLATFEATGARPAHWDDQQSLYENLLYASPTLTHAQIADYFKDATFGVRSGDVESVEVPRPGVTIVRDKSYGVPHIYGLTRGDVEFGAGYAGAEDRLFLMDILRHTARAELSSFVGGAAGNREMDRTQWAIAPYTEADLQRQFDLAPQIYGTAGTQLQSDATNFVDGINAYIQKATSGQAKLPAEYAVFGQTPQPWKVTDVIAEASLIGGIFGKGGGNELHSALLLEALEKRFGRRGGERAWSDLRSKNDPEAPTTILHRRFPYETASAFSPRGLALPDPGSVRFTPVGPPVASTSSTRAAAPSPGGVPIPNDGSIGSQLLRDFTQHHDMSNWELVSARGSANGHPIGVLGPQVGYYVPQILMEEDLHGPGFDARGATFPGVNLMVQLGHGRDYAWSATTATSDNVDTFAEVLCQDAYHYLYKGHCLAMERLDRTNSWTPHPPTDTTPPGSETLTAWRTVHGIVYARGRVHGKPVAFVSARTTYFHEADSAIGFFRLNDPSFVRGPQSFRRAVDGINFAFNWGYIDSKHIAYQLSGWYPQRARGTSPDFPILGTGQYDWQGYDPNLHTMRTIPMGQRPFTIDPPYLVSWNNKQAPGWAAADDKFSYGPVSREQMIAARVKAGLRHGHKMTLQQLVQAMEEPASQDLEAWALMPILRRAIGRPRDPRLRSALSLLSSWAARGAHRRDLNRDGRDEDEPAIALMDAWWPSLTGAIFDRTLGPAADRDLKGILRQASVMPGDQPSPPDYDDGWWGYVDKDLRDIFDRRHVRGRWSRGYCGGGNATRCRRDLRTSLRIALRMTRQQLYGTGDCASTPNPACFDQNRSVIASGVDEPPFPFQNRPTFQQTVEVTRSLPR